MVPRTDQPKSKANGRPDVKHNSSHNLQISDYENDINSLPPQGPIRTNIELNFSVLRRYLPFITSILYIVPYSAIYLFSKESQTWEKSGIEGTLFVCSLPPLSSQAPDAERFAAVVLNRRGMNNFNFELTSAENVEISEEFIILQDEERIWGVWIFEEMEPSSTAGMREELGVLLKTCAGKMEKNEASHEGSVNLHVDGNDESKNGTESKLDCILALIQVVKISSIASYLMLNSLQAPIGGLSSRIIS